MSSGGKIGDDDGRFEDLPEPTIAQRLLSNTRYAWIWLLARIYLSVAWFGSAVFVWESHLRVTTDQTGVAVSFVNGGADRVSPVLVLLVVGADAAIGLLLAAGSYVGATAFLSLILTWNPVTAGPPAWDPLATALTLLLILGWRVAGWYGADRWLLFDRDLPDYLRARQVRFREILTVEDRTVRGAMAWTISKACAAASRGLLALAKGWKILRFRRHR